jgi:hypothetical protein
VDDARARSSPKVGVFTLAEGKSQMDMLTIGPTRPRQIGDRPGHLDNLVDTTAGQTTSPNGRVDEFRSFNGREMGTEIASRHLTVG